MSKKTRVSKKILSTGVAAALALTMCPLSAFAEDPKPFPEEWNNQNRLSVTAPVAIVFGSDGNGWNVNSTSGDIPKATGTFKSTGTPVRISGIQYIEALPEKNDDKAFSSMVGSKVYMSKNAEITPSASKVEIPLSAASSAAGTNIPTEKDYIIPSAASFDFELELPDSRVDASKADGGTTAYPFGKLKYVFQTASGLNFFLTDLRKPSAPVVYTLPEVKAHAYQIAEFRALTSVNESDGTTTYYKNAATYDDPERRATYNMYLDFVKDFSKYECKVNVAASNATPDYYDLWILGLNQHELETPEPFKDSLSNRSLYRETAGLTFQFKDSIGYAAVQHYELEVQTLGSYVNAYNYMQTYIPKVILYYSESTTGYEGSRRRMYTGYSYMFVANATSLGAYTYSEDDLLGFWDGNELIKNKLYAAVHYKNQNGYTLIKKRKNGTAIAYWTNSWHSWTRDSDGIGNHRLVVTATGDAFIGLRSKSRDYIAHFCL